MKPICITNSLGHKEWWMNNLLHREDGPAVEWVDGAKFWYINGKRNREAGPAIEYVDGTKIWYLNDQLHRTDGPAYECANGNKLWYYCGKQIDCKDNQEFLRMIKLIIFL